ncbi:MAG: FMN-binding protein [Chitinispirillaceae bacterium]|nr:FMN-binding protein [Chitinispirillaceae bacterium]
MGIVVKIIGGIFAIIVVGIWLTTLGLKDIREMPINDVDLQKVQDGVYTGSFKKTRWKNNVQVTVKNHRIVDIVNTNELPPPNKKIVDKAINSILSKQSVVIDVVSGASVNTKAFQKAVENALKGVSENP